MKFFIGLSFTFFILSLVNCAEDLKIDVISKPEECDVKSKSGDMLTMHYTGTLSDGKKFDSSCHQQQRERTFIMIKPDGVQRNLIGEIIKRFEQKGLKLVAMKFLWPSEKLLHKHYEVHTDKPFFTNLIKYVSSGPVVAMAWEGWNSVKIGRTLLGVTRPTDSLPGTIRGDFAIDVERNIIHGSDSVESANEEIKLWFTDEELINWNSYSDNWLYSN